MAIFQVSRLTIYNWFDAWDAQKLVGVYSRPGRGRKPLFSPEQQEQIHAWVKANPKNLKGVQGQIKETWGITASKDTIKRIIKSLSMSWHRVRRVVGGSPDPEEYASKVVELETLRAQAAAGEIDLRYFDEAGFSLTSNSPYAWQDKDDPMTVKSQRSKPFNVVGLMNTRQELESFIFTGSITSAVVIACIDDFAQRQTQRTVIVMDQAPIHLSQAMEAKRSEWESRGIYLFCLPSYSPQLNLIEILWRFMKYEWIEFSAYEGSELLLEYLEKVLKGFGKEYIINFA